MRISRAHAVRWFFADFQRPWWEWAETLAITAAAVALGWRFNPSNPFYAQAAFPWPVLAPVLLALRYGVGPGLVSAGLMVLAYVAGQGRYFPAIEDGKLFFLGILLVTLLCGEFSGAWRTRLRRRDEIATFIDEKLEQITRRYYLLRLSHERLEQSLLARPVSLRDGLIKLRRLAGEGQDRETMPGAKAFLELAAQYCQVEQAALYAVEDDRPLAEAIARLGEQSPLAADDPMLRYALAKGQLAHLQMRHLRDGGSRYLIAAPIRPAGQPPLGVLLVERLPFVALHNETVQILSVLCAYYGDLVHSVRSTRGTGVAGCPIEFAGELARLHRLYQEAAMPSSLVALRFGPHVRRDELFRQIARQRRTLDMQWEVDTGEGPILVTLMPLGADAATDGYIERIDAWLNRHYGQGLGQFNIRVHQRQLGGDAYDESLRALLAECGAVARSAA